MARSSDRSEGCWGGGEFVGRIIQETDAGGQRQIPLEVRLERTREYILKACEEEGVNR